MKYTTSDDKVVAKDIKRIKEAGKDAETLILFGSFGRGEGLVLDNEPRNDYDLLLVGSEETKQAIEEAVPKAEVHIHSGETTCTQQWFEIKYASQLLVGKPLKLPNWKPYDIPYADAINSIERRAVSMLIAKYELSKENPDLRKVTEQIAKGLIAIGDAILIKRGQFHPLYSVRALMLSDDDIGGFYSMAVSTKLTGSPELNTDQLWDLWHKTRQAMRSYQVDNQLQLPVSEALFAITDRTEPEKIKELIEKLGAGRWL